MYGDQDELRSLLEGKRAQELMRAGTERARQLLISYLRQEGWDSEGRYALVDVGWRGRIPAALAGTLSDTDVSMPDLLLYFGLESGALDRMPPELASHLEAYFFDRSRDEAYVAPLPGIQVMIEMFCVADHAPITGYTTTPDGRVGPVIDGVFDEALEWGVPRVRRVVEEFVDVLVLDDDLVDSWTDLRPAIDELLREFWTSPTPEEVAAWGAFPVASDEVHSDHYAIAKPVSSEWILEALKTRARKVRKGGGEAGVGHIWYWPAGVVASSPLQYRTAYYRPHARLPASATIGKPWQTRWRESSAGSCCWRSPRGRPRWRPGWPFPSSPTSACPCSHGAWAFSRDSTPSGFSWESSASGSRRSSRWRYGPFRPSQSSCSYATRATCCSSCGSG